jgi:Flp pilus assembly pilin Flp
LSFSGEKALQGGFLGIRDEEAFVFVRRARAITSGTRVAPRSCRPAVSGHCPRAFPRRDCAMKHLIRRLCRLRHDVGAAVFVEYLLLLTLVGIGVICGLATLKTALIAELNDLATAINSITCP